ncbi:hypothetical protein FFT49_23810 [Klebsiella pneumoniae]|nr:hypothetical protein FFT49_23810 [Klebsiella pneumoniae]
MPQPDRSAGLERDQLKHLQQHRAGIPRAHHAVLSKYAEEELNRALNDTLGPLVRAMVLKAGDGKPARQHHRPSGHRAGEEVMHQVVTFLTGKVSAFSSRQPMSRCSPDRLPASACAYGPRRRQHARRRKVWRRKSVSARLT